MNEQERRKAMVEDFRKLWAAYCPPLREEKGAELYDEFVARCEYPDLLRRAVEEIGVAFARRNATNPSAFHPRLSHLKARFFDLVEERKKAREEERFGAGAVCGGCLGYRTVYILTPEAGEAGPVFRDFRREFHPCDPVPAPCPLCTEQMSEEVRRGTVGAYMPPRVAPQSSFYPGFIPDFYGEISGAHAIEGWYFYHFGRLAERFPGRAELDRLTDRWLRRGNGTRAGRRPKYGSGF